MIQGANWTLLEIPGTGSEQLGDFLVNERGFQRLTPQFTTSAEGPNTFTIVRKPYARMRTLYHSYDTSAKEGGFIEWYSWISSREEDPLSILKPYSLWTLGGCRVFKYEELGSKFLSFMGKMGVSLQGFDLDIFKEDHLPPLTKLERDFIKEQKREDFTHFMYKTNPRSII